MVIDYKPENKDNKSRENHSQIYFAKVATLFFVYYITAKYGLELDSISGFATLVWAPTGIALAALLIFGRKLWPGIFIGAFLVNFLSQGAPLLVAIAIGIGNTFESLVAVSVLRLFFNFDNSLRRLQDAASYITVAGIAAPVISASVGVGSLVLAGMVTIDDIALTWSAWWLGDALGALTIGPLLLVLFTRQVYRPYLKIWRLIEGLFLVLIIFITCRYVFFSLFDVVLRNTSVIYLVFPLLIISAIRFGIVGAVSSTFFISVMAVWGTAINRGPFVFGSLSHNLLLLQIFMGSLSLTGLLLASTYEERKKRNELLLKEQKENRAMLESLDRGVIATDNNGKVVYINQVATTVLHISRDEVVGKRYDSVLKVEKEGDTNTGSLYNLIDTVLVTGISHRWPLVDTETVYCFRKDGTKFPIAQTASPIMQDGRVNGCVLVFQDVTPEITSHLEHDQLSSLVELTDDAIVWKNLDGTITAWNKAAEKLYGFSAGEMIGKTIDIIIPIDRLSEYSRILSTIKEGKTVRVETVRKTRNGKLLEIDMSISPIKDRRGIITGVSSIARYIGERKKIERQMLLQTKALKAAANAIVITDVNGKIEWVNPAFTTLTGYGYDEAVGKSTRLLKSGYQDAAFYDDLWSTVKAGKVWQKELVNKRKDGSFYNEEMTITPVFDENGMITHFVAIKLNITERKREEDYIRREKIIEEEKARSEFIADEAHELRTPLAIIKGNVDLALRPASKNMINTDQVFRDINSEVKRLTHILSDLSILSSKGGHLKTLNRNEVDISKLIQDIVERCKKIARSKRISIEIQEMPEARVVGYEAYIEKAFVNIIKNAITYGNESGWIKITGTIQGTKIIIDIGDNGIGIDEENLPKIFDRFFRADKSSARLEGRTGLGLAIVKKVVEDHGGEVSVRSELGVGSTFSVILPLA